MKGLVWNKQKQIQHPMQQKEQQSMKLEQPQVTAGGEKGETSCNDVETGVGTENKDEDDEEVWNNNMSAPECRGALRLVNTGYWRKGCFFNNIRRFSRNQSCTLRTVNFVSVAKANCSASVG